MASPNAVEKPSHCLNSVEYVATSSNGVIISDETIAKRTPPTRVGVGGEMIFKLTRILGSSATATQHQNARTGEDGQRGRLGD